MSVTYTIRIPDCGSVNRLLAAAGFVDLLIFALSFSCLCGTPVTADTFDDDDTALFVPKQYNQLSDQNRSTGLSCHSRK